MEVKTVHDIEPKPTLFPELKAIQINELMSLGRRFPDVVHTQVPAAILEDDKKRYCSLFMHDFSRPSHPASAAVAQTGV
jgi:hypothetical protein